MLFWQFSFYSGPLNSKSLPSTKKNLNLEISFSYNFTNFCFPSSIVTLLILFSLILLWMKKKIVILLSQRSKIWKIWILLQKLAILQEKIKSIKMTLFSRKYWTNGKSNANFFPNNLILSFLSWKRKKSTFCSNSR